MYSQAVLVSLVKDEVITLELAERLRRWRHSGCSVCNGVRIRCDNTESRKQLARYMPPPILTGEDGIKSRTELVGLTINDAREPETQLHRSCRAANG